MRLSMRQSTQFITITLFVAGTLMASYYVFWLRPRLEIPNALIATQTLLYTQRQSLAETRLVLLEIARLNSTDNLANAHTAVTDSLASAYEQSQDTGNSDLPYQPVGGTPTTTIQFINQDLPDAFTGLQHTRSEIRANQKTILEQLKTVDDAFTNIYSYNPALDIGNLDPATQSGQIIQRASAAKAGLENITEKIDDLPLPETDKANVKQELHKATDILGKLITAADQHNTIATQKTRDAFINQFPQAQQSALTAEQSIIQSPASVSMLTDLTNMLLSYDFWLDRINQTLQSI